MGKEQFLRTEMLLGEAAMKTLAGSHVAVFGLGGVGSWCVEALARAGVGTLTLVDHDQVGVTNINRQIQAVHSAVGQDKTEAMAGRVRDINPDCRLRLLTDKYEAQRREEFFTEPYDYIADAIDLVSCKLDLIETALTRNIPIISSMGTGNKLDPSLFRVADISKTEGCALARVLRKELKKRGIVHHKVVFSPELPVKPEQMETPPPGRRTVPASAPWVPPVAGFLLAGAVIRDLIKL